MSKRVIIATPSYDGKVCAEYCASLAWTMKQAEANGILLYPIFASGDALVTRARNRLIQTAVDANDIAALVFIDADIGWKADQFFRLISHEEDFVGGAYRQKIPDTRYVFVPKPSAAVGENGLVEIDGIGTGFLKLSAECFRKLHGAAVPYKDGPTRARAVFETVINDGHHWSEDLLLCKKWREEHNGKVFLDTAITCTHTGSAMYTGDVREAFA